MRKVGSGITERTKPDMVPATPEALRAFFKRHNANLRQSWGGYADVIEAARCRLAEIEAEAPSIHDDLDGYNGFFVERVTEGWYLHSIDIEAKVAEQAVAEGRPWQAVACAMQIGELLTELRMKELWEPQAMAGAKSLKGSRDGANARRRTFAGKHEAIQADYREREERLGSPAAKAATAKAHGISRRHLNRILSKSGK